MQANGNEYQTAELTIAQRADPWVYRHSDGYYYFTAPCPNTTGLNCGVRKRCAAWPMPNPRRSGINTIQARLAQTVSEDGETDILVYHARTYKDIAGNPLTIRNRQASRTACRISGHEINVQSSPLPLWQGRFAIPVENDGSRYTIVDKQTEANRQ